MTQIKLSEEKMKEKIIMQKERLDLEENLRL